MDTGTIQQAVILLPFTHGIDEEAINIALTFAQQKQATLLLLSLLHPSPGTGPGTGKIVAGQIEQSRDFLELLNNKARRRGVLLQRMELFTGNVVRSIRHLTQEMACIGVLLFTRNGQGVLLETEEIKALLEMRDIPLYIVRFPTKKKTGLFAPLHHWLRGKRAKRD